MVVMVMAAAAAADSVGGASLLLLAVVNFSVVVAMLYTRRKLRETAPSVLTPHHTILFCVRADSPCVQERAEKTPRYSASPLSKCIYTHAGVERPTLCAPTPPPPRTHAAVRVFSVFYIFSFLFGVPGGMITGTRRRWLRTTSSSWSFRGACSWADANAASRAASRCGTASSSLACVFFFFVEWVLCVAGGILLSIVLCCVVLCCVASLFLFLIVCLCPAVDGELFVVAV